MEENDSFTCKLCNKEENENSTRVECTNCKAKFHKACVEINDNMLSWVCEMCQKLSVPPAPKSHRSKSVRSQVSSTLSQKLALQMLEEEKTLLQKSIDEKLKIEQEFLRRKYEVLNEEGSRASGSVLSSTEKVRNWIEKTTVDPENPNVLSSTTIPTKAGRMSVTNPVNPESSPVIAKTSKASETAIISTNLKNSLALTTTKITSYPPTSGCIELANSNNLTSSNAPETLNVGSLGVNPNTSTTYVGRNALSSTFTQRQPTAPPVPYDPVLDSRTNANNEGPNIHSSGQRRNLNLERSIFSHDISTSAVAARRVVSNELPSFNGKSSDWPEFISAYEFSTNVCELSEFENASRLHKSLKGVALDSVKNTLFLPNGASNAIDTLRRLFGQPEFVINELLESLRESKKPSTDNTDSIIQYSLNVGNLCAAMKRADLNDHLSNPILLQELVNYLPSNLMFEWAQFKHQSPSSNIDSFSTWLKFKSDSLLCVLQRAPLQEHLRSSINVHMGEQSRGNCIACNFRCQSLEVCSKFASMKLSEKWEIVKSNNICRTCLKRHRGECRLKGNKCGVNNCSFGHHKLLHNPASNAIATDTNNEGNINMHKNIKSDILFKVIPIKISKNGKEVCSYAILDDCSSLTLIEQSLADTLNIVGQNQPLHIKWTGNTTRSEMLSQIVNVEITGSNSSKKFKLDEVRTVASLNLPKQSQSLADFAKYKHLKGLPIPIFENAEPRMLIGLPHAKLLTTCKAKMGKSCEPIAAKTPLGWVLYGTGESNAHSIFHIDESKSDAILEEELKNYFSLESLGVLPKHSDVASSEEKRAEQLMADTTCFKGDYFETGLIWRFDSVKFPPSYENAERRLVQLEKRLLKEPELKEVLNHQIKNYLEQGYARILENDEIVATSDNCWYLPVFVVRNPNKPGKIRMVWDAASKVKNVSLNSMLLKGPDTLTSLPGILRRFREKPFAFTADIKEMFHRIHIKYEDQQFQRFLWRFDENSEPSILCMNVMTFGATCSPASANYILNLNAKRFESEYPEAVNSIKKSHYVDDLLECCDTREQAIEWAQNIKNIHAKGGFQLRNWASNDEVISTTLNGDSLPTDQNMEIPLHSENGLEKVLGLWWETKTDSFTFLLKHNKANKSILRGEQVPSKREVLRTIMSIFDPLGLLSHILVYPRILLQDIWRSGCSWDEPIPKVLFSQWKCWVENLPALENLKIPRNYGLQDCCKLELHTFVDSSEDAFACAVYIRVIKQSKISCILVAAKSKVAPLKPISMPRLELQAALIGARLGDTIKKEQNFTVNDEFYWSDSETVLSWLKSDARRYRQFVAVRVGEILELTKASQWRYVPSKLNVADQATRKSVTHFSIQSPWFEGPYFLYESIENWPADKVRKTSVEEIRPQYAKGELYFHLGGLVDVKGRSNWMRVRRAQAYVFRFVHNMLENVRNPSNKKMGPLTKDEYLKAENILFKECQQEGFPDEYSCLANKPAIPVEKTSIMYKDAPFIDSYGVIRSNSRLSNSSDVLYEVKKPVILPKKHELTYLLLDFYHVKYHHINMETSVNEMRQLFIIPSLRVQMKSIKFKCQFCKNKRAKPLIPFMANVPDARLASFTRPFSYVGIDYFGPFIVQVKRSNVKRYGVIITCLTVRAVHIEIASSLTTDSCMMCLQRFICRRGQPIQIYSDNGKNLRGASKELILALQSVDENLLADKFTNETTEWIFIPPSAPHMGGAWERLVRSVKCVLSAILPLRTPTEELLLTMMHEVENVVNSRPLTYIPLDSELDEALTPNHFLLGSSSGKKPLGEFSSDAWLMKNNWKKSEEYANRLWKRWVKIYLPELRRRHTFNEHVSNVKVGDIAILCDTDLPRNQWPKVKILAVHPSKDGCVRRVTVKTAKRILERPVSKLAVLDIRQEDSSTTTE